MEQLIEILRILQPNTLLCQVTNGVVINLTTLEEIPVEHLMYHRVPDSGLYTLSEATCEGVAHMKREFDHERPDPVPEDRICVVGAPAARCVNDKSYSVKKCAVYSLNKFDEHVSIHTNMSALINLVDEYILVRNHY